MAGPYRDAVATERLEAATREGQAILKIDPQHVSLSLAGQVEVTIGERFLTVVRFGRRRDKKSSHRIDDGRIVVARAWPTHDVALWRELRPGVMERVVGLRPLEVWDERHLGALQDLERLGFRLGETLRSRGRGVRRSTEYGKGQHRVLELDFGDRLVFHARPVFRERPRRVVEVCADGSLVVPHRKGDRRARVEDHFGVILSGDRVRFCDREGRDLASVFLPWISPQDRAEITRRIQRLVEQGVPAPRGVGAAARVAAWLGLSEA